MNKTSKVLGVALVLLCACLVEVEVAFGQASAGTLVGTVTDQSGAVVPGVEITVTNVGTGALRTTVTNSAGGYSVPLLQPGTYKITAVRQGFKQAVVENVRLRVNEEQRNDLAMEVGEVTQEVSVTASAVALGTETPVIGEVISDKQIVDLPLNGRNFVQLATLSAGVSAPALAQGESAASRGRPNVISISGQREFTTDVRFDGIPSKDSVYGTIGMQPDVDSVAEFKVQRGYASSDIGLSGRIDVVSKSGTNEFHGSAWEFLRNEKFDAKGFFPPTKLPYRQNQFGVAGGGPIITNRLFVFADYEGARIRQTSSTRGNIPTQAQLSGNFVGLATVVDPQTRQPFPGNIIPSGRISKFAMTFSPYIPAPNAPGAVNRIIPTRFLQDDDKYNMRVDYTLSQSDAFFGRYTHTKADQFSEGFIPLGGSEFILRSRNAVLGWTHIFNPNLLNQFKAGLNRVLSNPGVPEGARDNPIFRDIFGIKNVNELPDCNALPSVSMAGFNSVGGRANCIVLTTNNYHVIDNLTYTRGRHRIGAGFEIIRPFMRQVIGNFSVGIFNFSGQFTGNSVADYLLGNPASAQAQNWRRIPDRQAWWPSFYLNDEIRITQNFSMSLGLRYSYFQPLAEKNHRLVSFDPTVPGGGFLFEPGVDPAIAALGRLGPAGLMVPDKNDWAPRLGLAFSPWKNTAIRSSYGIFYQDLAGNNLNLQQTGPPFVPTIGLASEASTPTINLDTDAIFPAVGINLRAPGSSPFGQKPNVRTPYLQSWTLSVQQSLPGGLFAEGAYIGSKGTKLDKHEDSNIPKTPPPPGFTGTLQSRRPFPDFGFILYGDNDANSYYHGLQLTLKKAFGAGLSFLTSYTYSKSLDGDSFDSKATRNSIPDNPDKARSTFDQRQRFAMSWVYDLPGSNVNNPAAKILLGGWQLNGITTVQSGFSFHPVTSRDFSNRLSLFGNLTNRTCNGNLPASQKKSERWFDTSCFPLPAENTIGNTGFHILDTDGVISQDLGIVRNFKVREPLTVQFRAEAFNLFNHTNFGRPVNNAQSPLFGRVLSALPARIIQFGLKFRW